MRDYPIPTAVLDRSSSDPDVPELFQVDLPFGHRAVPAFSSIASAQKFRDSLPEQERGKWSISYLGHGLLLDYLIDAQTHDPRLDLLACDMRSIDTTIVSCGTIEAALKAMDASKAVHEGRMAVVYFHTEYYAGKDLRALPESATMLQERTEP